MPEIGPSGSEGGVARQRHPYPYRSAAFRPLQCRINRSVVCPTDLVARKAASSLRFCLRFLFHGAILRGQEDL